MDNIPFTLLATNSLFILPNLTLFLNPNSPHTDPSEIGEDLLRTRGKGDGLLDRGEGFQLKMTEF
jgi:hypothetical protein